MSSLKLEPKMSKTILQASFKILFLIPTALRSPHPNLTKASPSPWPRPTSGSPSGPPGLPLAVVGLADDGRRLGLRRRLRPRRGLRRQEENTQRIRQRCVARRRVETTKQCFLLLQSCGCTYKAENYC